MLLIYTVHETPQPTTEPQNSDEKRVQVGLPLFIFERSRIEMHWDRKCCNVIGLFRMRTSMGARKCTFPLLPVGFGEFDWTKLGAFDP